MITSESSSKKRVKVNFMLDKELLERFKTAIPAGERSDFINDALEEAISLYRQKKAFQMMDKLREKMNLRMSIKEMIKLKNYGRP